MTTTTDAGAYRRLDEGLKAHRGDTEAYRRLGGQLEARRHLLDSRYGNRRLFVRERLVPLGLKESAAYKLVYDLEQGKLQGRGGYSAGKILAVTDAYGITPDSLIAVLDGGELEPSPPGSRGRHRSPGPPATPPAPAGFITDEVREKAQPYADEIWRRVHELTGGRAPDPAGGGQPPDPGGAALFGEGTHDQIVWDGAAGHAPLAKTWLIAVLQSRDAAAQGRQRGTG